MTSTTKRRSQSASPIEHWTDDLPVCSLSGVGFCQNQRYRLDGGRREEHEFEDQSFHFHFVENNCCLYGVFDGHSGRKAAEFAAQKLPAELLFGQLTDGMNDNEIKSVLKQAFLEVEKGFFTSIGDELVEKTLIQEDFAGLSPYEAAQRFPEKMERLRTIEQEIASGTTAVVALIYNNKLFVTNVGNSRAVLCTIDKNGRLHVQQLSTDHVIANQDEYIRLSKLGLNIEQIRSGSRIAKHESTRNIGDYSVKGGYKECDILSSALEEPVIAEPDSCGAIVIDDSFYFLLLMSDGLYKSLEVSKPLNQDVNIEIVGLVTGELQAQTTINGVCQAVVDRICRFHHDGFMNKNNLCERRDDMTLLLRLFTAKLGGQTQSPVSPLTNFHSFSGQSNLGFVHIPVPSEMLQTTYPAPPLGVSSQATSIATVGSETTAINTTANMASANETLNTEDQTTEKTADHTDSSSTECVESYVDFSEYYKAIEKYGEDYVAKSVQL